MSSNRVALPKVGILDSDEQQLSSSSTPARWWRQSQQPNTIAQLLLPTQRDSVERR
jgi:hypothetical protein